MKKTLSMTLLLVLLFLLAGCARQTTPPLAVEAPTSAPAEAQPTSASPAATEPAATASPAESDLFVLAQEFINQLAAGEYEAATARFDDAMLKAAPAPALQQIWEQLLGQAGAYQQQLDASSEQVQDYTRINVTTQFEKAAVVIQVVFNEKGQISGLFFKPAEDSQPAPAAYSAPSYADPGAFTESEVTVGSGEWALPGTLSMPAGDGPFPAVVLVHGSGPNDQDETIGPNKPFKDLAWGLASQGIAVLRYDKRTKAHAQQYTPELINASHGPGRDYR